MTLAQAGRSREAERLATAGYQQALADRSPEAQAWFAWSIAQTVGERGHVRTAAQHAREALALLRQMDRPFLVRGGLVNLALAVALSGSASEAASLLAEQRQLC